jgi:hypothetical protein
MLTDQEAALAQPPAPEAELNPGDRVMGWLILKSRLENSEPLSKRTKMTQL